MIQPQTTIKIFDNSGVKAIKCVHVEKKAYRHCALVSNIVLGVVTQTKKKSTTKSSYKKGDLVRVLVVSSKKETQCGSSGIFFKNFENNLGIIVQPTKKQQAVVVPAGSRFESHIPLFFKNYTLKNLGLYSNLIILCTNFIIFLIMFLYVIVLTSFRFVTKEYPN
jgi:ribosomal protein L14